MGGRSSMVIVLGGRHETTIGGDDGVTNPAKARVVENDHTGVILR